ncbi:ABC transporter B family protein [Tieghemostelium lacteum]|uniref:ABC transporter B family protein n=1 Tax=Tieghemostelium lacteum TaxID=361077 RepID=A0A151Z6Q6_TIELA|nr:ABC transporter B family protein [Tieghemostelium lacteum]|eukprot:KYQ89617.1 ABC transporter B family protein [Tieghemostelium lacteum]
MSISKNTGKYAYLDEEEEESEDLLDKDTISLQNQNKIQITTPTGSLKKKKNVQFQFDVEDNNNSASSSSSSNRKKESMNYYYNDEDSNDNSDRHDILGENELLMDEESLFDINYSAKRCVLRLISYLQPQFWYYLFAILALAVTVVCQLSLPFYFANGITTVLKGRVLNEFLSEETFNTFVPNVTYQFDWLELSKMIIVIIVVQSPFIFIRYILFTMAGNNFANRLKSDLLRSLLTQEISYFEQQNRSGDIKAVINSDSVVLQNCITVVFSTMMRSILLLLGGCVILISISWKVSIVILSFIVIYAVAFVLFNSALTSKNKYLQEKQVAIGSLLDNAISNIKEIRLLNAESKEIRTYDTQLESIYRSSKQFALWTAFYIAIASLATLIILLVSYLYLMNQTLQVDIYTLQYILYCIVVFSSLNGLVVSLSDIQRVVSSSRRVFSLMDRKPLIHFQGGILPSSDQNPNSSSIAFESVSYQQKNTSVLLSDISFTASKGQIISLVGPSPNKDIIFSLLQGLYYPTKGSVYIGRIDTKVLDLYYIRNKLCTVSSSTVIFDGTVEQNIRYGLTHYTNQAIIEASKKANLHDFIISLPNGYDSMLGHGKLLTSQHIQKISLARAFLRQPQILLIDESSCIFDSQSDDIRKSIDELIQNRTVFIIPTRLSTLQKSSQILVFDDSRIIEKGTHQDLIKNPQSFYNSIILKQFYHNSNNSENNNNSKNNNNNNSNSY